MTPVIRIDDEVMDELKKRAISLGLVFEPPNSTLRKVLGLDIKSPVEQVVQNMPKKTPVEAIEVELNDKSREYVYIPIHKDKRSFFPGYKESFEMITDVGVLKAHVPYSPDKGGHIRGRFGAWFSRHPELKGGDKLKIRALEPGRKYELSISNKVTLAEAPKVTGPTAEEIVRNVIEQAKNSNPNLRISYAP